MFSNTVNTSLPRMTDSLCTGVSTSTQSSGGCACTSQAKDEKAANRQVARMRIDLDINYSSPVLLRV
jgi:hypothetical protein